MGLICNNESQPLSAMRMLVTLKTSMMEIFCSNDASNEQDLTHGKAFMYSLSDAIYHVAKLFSHVTGGKVIEDFHLPEVGKPPISPVVKAPVRQQRKS